MPSSAVASASPSLFIGCRRCSPRLRAADFPGVPLAALATVVGYAVFGCCVGLAVAFIGCRLCLPQLRLCRSSMLRCSLLSLVSSACCRSHRPLPLLTLLVCLPPLCVACNSLLSLVSSASRRSHQLLPLLNSLTCGTPLCSTCCLQLSLSLSAMPSLSFSPASPLLSSVVAVAQLNSLACVQQLQLVCRSLLSSAMPSSAVASSSPSLSSAVAIACITRSCATALRCVPLAALAVVLC